MDELPAVSIFCSILFSASFISTGSGLSLSSSINRLSFNLTLAFCKFETLFGSGLSLSSSINRFNCNLALAFCINLKLFLVVNLPMAVNHHLTLRLLLTASHLHLIVLLVVLVGVGLLFVHY